MKTTDYKSLREHIKECFKTMPFSEAVALTIRECEQLSHISTRARINRMCIETSKYYGKYDI